MMKKLVIVGLILMGACASPPRGPAITVTWFTENQPSSVAEHVEVFSSFESVKRGYKEIAFLSGKGHENDVIVAIRRKASDIGANAIILWPTEVISYGSVPMKMGIRIPLRKNLVRASAIIFTD